MIVIEWVGRVTLAASGRQAELHEVAVHEIRERQDRARGVLLQSGSARRMTLTRAATLAVNDATYVAWNAHDPDAVAAVIRRGRRCCAIGRDGRSVHFTDMAGLLAQLGLA